MKNEIAQHEPVQEHRGKEKKYSCRLWFISYWYLVRFLFCATNSRGKIGPIFDKYSTLLLVKVHTHTYHSKGFTSWHYCGFVNWQGTLMGWNRKLIWGNNQYLHFDLMQEDLSISWSFAIKYLKVFGVCKIFLTSFCNVLRDLVHRVLLLCNPSAIFNLNFALWS